MPKRVLSTSWDASVLATRNLVIESAGYEVVATREPETFLQLLVYQHFDAAVIGDSIRQDIRVDLVRLAKAFEPDLPLLVFVQTDAQAQLFALADYRVNALGPPEHFLAALRAAVGDERATTAGL